MDLAGGVTLLAAFHCEAAAILDLIIKAFPEVHMHVRARIALMLAPFLGGCLPVHSQSQIKFTNAYPGTKFDRPVYFGAFPGRAKTNVVLEQHLGNALLVYLKDDGSVARDTLYHLSVDQSNEMGLLGIAFHPGFNTNHKYYICYNPPGTPYHDIVEERIADATGMKDSGTKGRILINIDDPYSNHNGGTIGFGPKDGFLYFGVGDGGSANDPNGNAQNKSAWLGKMHRIDVNSKDTGLEYHIPADNPFVGGARPEIFAFGLRNPWKWTFDALTGDMWVGDVGQDNIEEVDILVKGGNYGWKIMEGNRNTGAGTKDSSMIGPLFTYDHSTGNCVIGGVVFRSNPASKYYGSFFISDNGTSQFWVLKPGSTGTATATSLGTTPTGFSAFGSDAEGRVYGCGLGNGTIYVLESPDLTPAAVLKPGAAARAAHGRSFTVRPGGVLDARAFAASPVLEVFGLNGNRLGALRKDDARLPADMDAGVYLLKSASGDGASDLLRVK
jgi:glucose/arabinose dehydrogenase